VWLPVSTSLSTIHTMNETLRELGEPVHIVARISDFTNKKASDARSGAFISVV
jgi:hypothetical protein